MFSSFAGFMRGSRIPASAERRHLKSQSVDGSLARDRQELEQPKQNVEAEELFLLIEQITNQHEQQLEQEKAHADQKHQKLAKINMRLRQQRDAYEEKYAKLSDNYGEMGEHHKNLRQQFRMTVSEKGKLDEKNKYIFSRYKYLVDKVIAPYVKTVGLRWNDQSAATIDVVVHSLATDALEAGTLRDQVRVLQKEMLARIDKSDAIPDEQLAQDFRNLATLIKTLSRKIRLREDVDLVEVFGNPLMLYNVNAIHWEGRARKKCMVEAWVWSVLLHNVFDTPFAIFGPGGDNIKNAWQALFGEGHVHNWPKPSSICETWRCTTIESAFRGMAAQDIINNGKEIEDLTILDKSVLKTRSLCLVIIETELRKISPVADSNAISQIVDKAFALAGQVYTQRARLQITYPDAGAAFEKQTMMAMSNSNGNDVQDGTVAFIVNPGLTKWGDARGKDLEYRYDIVPALVHVETVEDIQMQTAVPEIESAIVLEDESAKAYADIVKRGL